MRGVTIAAAAAVCLAGGDAMAMKLASSAFDAGGMIPEKYSCKGEDMSPRLSWEGVPAGTKSLALINDDPDAPMGTWVHWVLYDLPPDTKELSERIPATDALPNGAKQGRNSWGRVGYGGPCPPPGPAHRYYFKLYALDQKLNLPAKLAKEELLKKMEGHILGQAELMGKFKR
jgi:Raf kinase inhibitor-like YbhB/YbcL family protein